MAFPVDILTKVDHESLELAAEKYMSQLPYRNTEYFSLSDSKQIEIGLCNVSFVPLYGTDAKKKLLALFSPDDCNTVVGLYLLDRWWGVEDVLKTAEPSKTGLIKVNTLGERIVLYVLNRIVLRNEKSSQDVFFLCHCEHEAAKILWKDGEAIGFYSFKPKGSLCRNFVTQCYQLPVMDTVFVRKCHRGQGHAIHILEDFVGSFRNEYIGLKFPLSEAMYKVCEKYLSIYPADKELLWEVEKIGSPFQRTLIANSLQKLKLKEKDQVVSKLNFNEDDAAAQMETEITKIQETTEYTVEIVEETIIDITKEVDDIPVTKRGRSSNLKRRAIRENSEERLSENIIRVEDIEAGVEGSVEIEAVDKLTTFSVKESATVLRSSVDTVTATVSNFAELRGSQKEEAHEIEKDIVTATSEGSPVTHLTTAGEIKSQRSSKDESEMVTEEYTIEIQEATVGSIDQSQRQSMVDVEIVKMSTGTEEEQNENSEKNKEVEEDKPVCEAEMEEIKQMADESKEEKTASKTEVAEQSETHAKSTEKEQVHWDVEITENRERAEYEVMAESGKENRDDNTVQEKSKPKDEDTVLQQSVEVKDQIEMETDSVKEALTTEDQLKQNEAETEVSEPNQTMTNKDRVIEKASENKLGPDEVEQVSNKTKLLQKRTSGLTPSRRSKRLRHQPPEKDFKTKKSVKTGQQKSKHHSKVMMQDEDTEQSTDEPEHEVSEVMEKIQEAQIENKAQAEITVETVSTMDVSTMEITQVEETGVSELVERKEIDQEEAPLQSSVKPPEMQELKTTPEEDEETVERSAVMLTLSEAKVVLVDLHEFSSKEAGDNHGETSIPEQEGMKLTMSSEQQATEENMRTKEQDGTRLDTKRSKAVIQQVVSVEPQVDAKLRTDENTEMDELISGDVSPEENEMANTNADDTANVECGSSELLRAAETDDKEKEPQITNVTGKITLTEKEAEEDVLENRAEDIKNIENKEANLAGQMDSDIEISSLGNEEEILISTERHLRRRTIRVHTPLISKSRSVQKQKAEADVEHQERHAVVSKKKTDTILMTKEREDEVDQDVSKMENKEEHFAELESVEEPNMSGNEYEKTSAIAEETMDVCMESLVKLPSLDEMVNINTEETPVAESSELPLDVETDDQEKEFQIVGHPEDEVSLVEPGKEVDGEDEDGTPVVKLQRATVVLVDLSKLSQNTEGEVEASEDLTHFQTEEKLELYESDKSEQKQSNLPLEEEEQPKEVQTQEDTEKTPEEEKMEEENTVEEQNKLDKQDMTFEEQKPTEDFATVSAEGSLVECNKTENKQNEDEGVSVSGLAQENVVQENIEEQAPISTQRSLRRRTIRVQSPPRRKSRRIQKQGAEVSEDKTEVVLITEKEADEVDQDVEIVDKEKAPQTSIVDATEKVIPIKEVEHETTETEASMEIDPMVGKEQTVIVGGTTIQTEEKVSQVSLVEAEPKEDEKNDGTPVIQLQKATVVLVDLNKLSQNTEGESDTPEVLHSQTEEKLEQDKPDNSELQLCNLTSEEKEQQEQLQKEEDTEKTPDKDKMEDENTVEEQNEPNKPDVTLEEQKPTEDLEEQNDLKVTEIVEVYRAVAEDVTEAVKSGEHPEKTTTMADETNTTPEAEKDHNITLNKPADSDIEMSGLAQEAPDTDQDVSEEEASVSTERSLRRRTIKIQSTPRRKSRRLQKQEAGASEDKTRDIPIRGKVVDEMQETLKKSTVEDTEVIPFAETESEDNAVEKGVEEINKMQDKETNLAVTRETGEETSQMEEEANLEQQKNETFVKNNEETTETEKSMEIDPVVGKEQTVIVGGTTIQTEEKVSQVSLGEAEPDEDGEKDDDTPVIQLQKAIVVLEDLNKLSQNTGESDTPEVLTHFQTEEKLEQDKPDNSEHQLCNLTSEEKEQQEQLQKEEHTEKTPDKDKMEDENTVEEQNEPNKPDVTLEEQKPTEDLEEQNDLNVTEIVEVYRAVAEDVEEAVTSGEHPEKTTAMADKTNIIQEAEKDHNITLNKPADSDIEMSGLAQEAPDTDQDVSEEEASVSTERSLRRRTIKIQSTPRRKSRCLQKQEAGASEDKTRDIPIRGKVVDEMQETLKKSTVEDTEVIPFAETESEDNAVEKGVEEINKMQDKETNLAVTRETGEETSQMEEEANLEQQKNELLLKNDNEATETETSMEIDPVVAKEQTIIAGGTIVQTEEKVSQVESTETNQTDNERITRRSLRLGVKSVTETQKAIRSTRLQKVELDTVKETNMSRNEQEETSATTKETVNVCVPIITAESNLESLDEMANTNVEDTTAVEPETSEMLMGEEINDKEEASQIVEDDKPIEAEPHEDDATPVILQKDTLLLVDLNILSQNTEEQTDITHFHAEEQLELCEPDNSEDHLCNLTSEEDKHDMTVEEQKPTNDLVGQNDGKEGEKVEEYKVVIDEDVEESVSTGEHQKTTTTEDKTNIIQETENNQDISLKEKQVDSDLEMKSLGQDAPEDVQEILEEEASVSTERSLRCRTVKIQSTPIKKSRRVQRQEAEVFEDKTGTVQLTGKRDEEVHKKGAEIDKEETFQKTTVQATENIVLLTEGGPDENVIEKGFEEIYNMENKGTNLGNEATPEMEGDKVNLEQQENELSVENEKETDVEENETLTKITENEILVEMDKTAKDIEEGVQEEEKAEPSQENTAHEQEEAVSLGENGVETNLTNEFKTTAVEEKGALGNSEQEPAFITRSLRYRTVTVHSTPRGKSKRLQRQELESERETDHLYVPIGKENEGEGVIQTNTDGTSEKSETKDDTKEEGNKIQFEILENNSGSQVNTEQNKTQEENLEREDVSVPNVQEEHEVSSVQNEAKPLQERENDGAAEGVQGSSSDLEETAVEKRSLRKRMSVETAAPRKSKRLRKQENEDDSEQSNEAVMEQTDSVEVTFTKDSVEQRSDATPAVFEGSHLGEEILQKKSDGDCNVHKDTEPDAGEYQEDQEEFITDEIVEEVIKQCVDLESITNEGFTLALEVEEMSDQEENKADEESGVVEAPKQILTSAEKYEKREENIADDNEKGLVIGKNVVQSSSTTASTRRKSMRLQIHESKKNEDESDSESEVQQTAKQRHQRKRKAITDSTSGRRSKRHVK